MGKECRFNDLVKRSGSPEVVTLWTKPQQDPVFMKAVRENRVLTVIHPRLGAKKDYGLIGFQLQPQAAYLVFPKPLPRKTDARVIGIHYNLIAERKETRAPVRPVPKSIKTKQAKVRKPPGLFEVLIRRTAVVETTVSITAYNRHEAAEKAVDSVRRDPFETTRAVVTNNVIAIEPSS